MTGKEIRISGAVIGETIQFDPSTLDLTFEVVNIPGDNAEIDKLGGLAEVLHQAVLDTKLERLKIIYNGPRPDLLKNEAQAIMTGTLDIPVFFMPTNYCSNVQPAMMKRFLSRR